MLTLKENAGDIPSLVAEMRILVEKAQADEEFIMFARDIVASSPYENREQLRVILEYVRDHVEYQPDPEGIELLTSPQRMMVNIREGKAVGDCDCMAIFTAAITKALGYTTRIILIDQEGTGYNHAAVEVYSEFTGYYYYVDPTSEKSLSIAGGKTQEANPLTGAPGYFMKLEVPV